MRDRIGIEYISVFNLPPVSYVELAADLGCRQVSVLLAPLEYNPHGYPPHSLRDDAALRREMIAAMRDREVSISLGDGFAIRPGLRVEDFAADLDIVAELGAPRINALSFDPDLPRSIDQLARLTDMAQARGMETVLEFGGKASVFRRLSVALEAIRQVGQGRLRLLVDAMHFFRSGGTPEDLAAAPHDAFGYIQLCDVPRTPVIPEYMYEAMYERLVPGKGDAPLEGILSALPRDLVVGIETPRRSAVEAGLTLHDCLEPSIRATRALLAALDD